MDMGWDAMEALLAIIVYMAPTIVAIVRKHRVAQVLVINLLLGWSIIGWIVALVWAVGERQVGSTIINSNVVNSGYPPHMYPPVPPQMPNAIPPQGIPPELPGHPAKPEPTAPPVR